MNKENLTLAVQRFQQGDSAAFQDIYDMTAQSFAQTAQFVTRGEIQMAEDVLQDAYLEICKSIGSLKDSGAFVPWANSIIKRCAIRKFEKAGKDRENLFYESNDEESDSEVWDFIEAQEAGPEAVYEQVEFQSFVEQMLYSIPEKQANILRLHYFEGKKVREIADDLAIPEGSVKSGLNSGRNAIKKRIEAYEEKHNIKMHSILVAPALKSIFGSMQESLHLHFTDACLQQVFQEVVNQAGLQIAGAVASATAAGASAAESTGAASGTAAGSGAGSAGTVTGTAGVATGGGILSSIGLKIAIGVLAIGVAVGGGAAGVHHVQKTKAEQKAKEAKARHEQQVKKQMESRAEAYSIYSNFLQEESKFNGLMETYPGITTENIVYATANIDGDDVPELVISLAEGDEGGMVGSFGRIYTLKDKKVKYLGALYSTSGENTGYYEKRGVVQDTGMFSDGTATYYHDITKKSSVENAEGMPYESYSELHSGNETSYRIGVNTKISQGEFQKKVKKMIGTQKLKPFEFHPISDRGYLALREGDFQYVVKDGTITISKYAGNEAEVTIPAKINGLPVTGIGDSAFAEEQMSETHTLASVKIPDSVQKIGNYAFAYCGEMKSVTLPKNLKELGDLAFGGTSITKITIPGGVKKYPNIFGMSGIQEITLSEGVTEISDGAFANCEMLQKISLPKSLKRIGSNVCYSEGLGQIQQLETIQYAGSKDDWKKIKIGSDNDILSGSSVSITYN